MASYSCTWPSCTKAFNKPWRLDEHLRSHTGEVSGWRGACDRFLLLLFSDILHVPFNLEELVFEKKLTFTASHSAHLGDM
jgi:hypothetical protein